MTTTTGLPPRVCVGCGRPTLAARRRCVVCARDAQRKRPVRRTPDRVREDLAAQARRDDEGADRRRAAALAAADAWATRHRLDPALAELLRALCAGTAPRALAAELLKSDNTIKTQVRLLLRPTGLRTTADLVARVFLEALARGEAPQP